MPARLCLHLSSISCYCHIFREFARDGDARIEPSDDVDNSEGGRDCIDHHASGSRGPPSFRSPPSCGGCRQSSPMSRARLDGTWLKVPTQTRFFLHTFALTTSSPRSHFANIRDLFVAKECRLRRPTNRLVRRFNIHRFSRSTAKDSAT